MCRKRDEKSPYEPAPDELAGSPTALGYELQMLRRCVQLLESFRERGAVVVEASVRNSVLEAALLHTRNLLEFFTGGQHRKDSLDEDSIRAGYFVGEQRGDQEGQWKTIDLPYTRSRKNDINKSLSHLTFKRVKGDYQWDDLPRIKAEIESGYAEFLRLLPEEDRGKWPPLEQG